MSPSSDSTLPSHLSKMKPLVVIAYNIGKSGIDRSDQMVAYATNIRKGIKWFRKLALHLFLGTMIVNAHIVYGNKKIPGTFSHRMVVLEKY